MDPLVRALLNQAYRRKKGTLNLKRMKKGYGKRSYVFKDLMLSYWNKYPSIILTDLAMKCMHMSYVNYVYKKSPKWSANVIEYDEIEEEE